MNITAQCCQRKASLANLGDAEPDHAAAIGILETRAGHSPFHLRPIHRLGTWNSLVLSQ